MQCRAVRKHGGRDLFFTQKTGRPRDCGRRRTHGFRKRPAIQKARPVFAFPVRNTFPVSTPLDCRTLRICVPNASSPTGISCPPCRPTARPRRRHSQARRPPRALKMGDLVQRAAFLLRHKVNEQLPDRHNLFSYPFLQQIPFYRPRDPIFRMIRRAGIRSGADERARSPSPRSGLPAAAWSSRYRCLRPPSPAAWKTEMRGKPLQPSALVYTFSG